MEGGGGGERGQTGSRKPSSLDGVSTCWPTPVIHTPLDTVSVSGRQPADGDRLSCPTRTLEIRIKAALVGVFITLTFWHKVEGESLSEHLLPFAFTGNTS